MAVLKITLITYLFSLINSNGIDHRRNVFQVWVHETRIFIRFDFRDFFFTPQTGTEIFWICRRSELKCNSWELPILVFFYLFSHFLRKPKLFFFCGRARIFVMDRIYLFPLIWNKEFNDHYANVKKKNVLSLKVDNTIIRIHK